MLKAPSAKTGHPSLAYMGQCKVTYYWFPTRTCQYQCLLLACDDPLAVIIFYLYDVHFGVRSWGKNTFCMLMKMMKKVDDPEVQDIF